MAITSMSIKEMKEPQQIKVTKRKKIEEIQIELEVKDEPPIEEVQVEEVNPAQIIEKVLIRVARFSFPIDIVTFGMGENQEIPNVRRQNLVTVKLGEIHKNWEMINTKR